MPGISSNAAAAKAYLSAKRNEARFTRRNRGSSNLPLTKAQFARKYGLNPKALYKELKRIERPIESAASVGRPKTLTPAQEEAIVSYVQQLQHTGFPARKAHVMEAATSLRRSTDPNAPEVSNIWFYRFMKDHPELLRKKRRQFDVQRYIYEHASIDNLRIFFERFKQLIQDYNIQPSECWNEDECGIRIGCLVMTVTVIIVYSSKAQQPTVIDLANRQPATLKACINAAGQSIPAYLIFKSLPTESWSGIHVDSEIRFARSDTAFSNAQIMLDWAQHFNQQSWKLSQRAIKSGKSLTEWFGCDAFFNDPYQPFDKVTIPPNTQNMPHDERIWRLLIIDGFTGHLDVKFILYCVSFDILIVVLPPHSTHLLQPLDVGVFQPLKQAQQRDIERSVEDGNFEYTRLDFLCGLQQMLDTSFTAHNILKGFKDTGIWPADLTPVMDYLLGRQLKKRKAIRPDLLDKVPSLIRFPSSSTSIRSHLQRYGDLFSSPTRASLQAAESVLQEAVLLDQNRRLFSMERLQRIEKQASRRRRGKEVRPSGEFITSVNLNQIIQQDAQSTAEAKEAMHKRELRHHRKHIINEIEALKKKHKADDTAIVGSRRLAFREWLAREGLLDMYNSYEASRAAMTAAIKNNGIHQQAEGAEPFYYDTQRQLDPLADDVYREDGIETFIAMQPSSPTSSIEITTTTGRQQDNMDPFDSDLSPPSSPICNRNEGQSSPQLPQLQSSPLPIRSKQEEPKFKKIQRILFDMRQQPQ